MQMHSYYRKKTSVKSYGAKSMKINIKYNIHFDFAEIIVSFFLKGMMESFRKYTQKVERVKIQTIFRLVSSCIKRKLI